MTESKNADKLETSAEIPAAKWDIASFSPTKKRFLFLAMCLFHLLTFVSFHMPYSYLPLYNESREISTFWTGLILGSTSSGMAVSCGVIAPVVMSKFSTRIVLSGGLAGLGISLLLFSVLDSIENLVIYQILSLIFRFSAGAFGGTLNVTIFAAYLAIYPEYVGTVTAIGEAFINGACALGPFLGGVLYDAGGFTAASVFPGALIFVSAIPAFFLSSLNSKKRRAGEEESSWTSILDPLVLFPLWHLASALILVSYPMPLLSPYAEEFFNADVVWSGTALLATTGGICIFSPIIGLAIDRYGPCKMLMASCVSLPLVYAFVGPLPLLSFITPSKTQVILSLALLGLAVPMACVSALPVMFKVYQARNGGKLPIIVINSLVSLYCAAFPIGIFIGTTTSGLIAPFASFGWSTGILGLIYIAESMLCIAFCIKVMSSTKTKTKVAENGDYAQVDSPDENLKIY
ncbi:uncharacterized protein LOC134823671 [Bolinopsis microptera]|uniref:uncharacterized protein LOC134823671 n=1 Tax=Bolinopsis microptera TaxID=2820187 RepID=UPI003079F442